MASAAKEGGGGPMMLIMGGALALILGGAGFYTVYSGLVNLPLPSAEPEEMAHEAAVQAFEEATPAAEFVPLEPILITLGGGDARLRQLQFVAQLEVEPGAAESLKALEPRVRDVLNTYLRAVRADDVDDPAALLRMRAQMLRRIQVVTGEGLVRDLLVSEFILR